jgi:hypothetical protein
MGLETAADSFTSPSATGQDRDCQPSTIIGTFRTSRKAPPPKVAQKISPKIATTSKL